MGQFKNAKTNNLKTIQDLRKSDDSDYDSENKEISRIRNSNQETVDSVQSFYPEFTSELNNTKEILAFENSHLLSLETQQQTYLFKALQQEVSVLGKKMLQQQMDSNYSLGTVKDSLDASLTELAAELKEISSNLILGKVQLRSELSNGLRNASTKLNDKIK